MKRPDLVVFVLAIAIAPSAHAQTPDARELVRQSVLNYEKAWRAGMQWSYTQTDVTREDGTREVDVSQVIPLDGTPYQRLIGKNGHALTQEEQRKEDDKYQKELHRRGVESPGTRQARIQKYEKERGFLVEIPAAYDFRLVGEDLLAGRSAWVVKMTPHPGFEPTMTHAGMLKHIDGRLWIDKKDVQWSRAEADVIDNVSVGLILARIGPGAHISLEFTRISDKLWVPKEITIKGEARILLVHNKNLDEELSFSAWRWPGP